MEAGLDSLAAVELRNAVAAAFSVTLSATAAFDFPTLAAMADHVARQLSALMPAQRQRAWGDHGDDRDDGREPTSKHRRATAAIDLAALTAQLASLAADVLGAEVTPQQPFMEVWKS